MSHCTLEATLKPKRFQFMPKTVISNVFIVQVNWEAVPNTWPGSSKASVAKCVVCGYMTAYTLCFKKQFTLLVFTVTKSDVDQF